MNILIPGGSMSLTKVQSAMQAAPGFSPGMAIPYRGSALPDGWLWEDGAQYSQAMYPELYAVIGTVYNTGGDTGITHATWFDWRLGLPATRLRRLLTSHFRCLLSSSSMTYKTIHTTYGLQHWLREFAKIIFKEVSLRCTIVEGTYGGIIVELTRNFIDVTYFCKPSHRN